MIFLHPSYFLFVILIFTTIPMITSADSWLMMWVFLEINLLLFIPLLFTKKSKYQSEAALKYFINQAISSVIILSSLTFMVTFYNYTLMLLYTAFSLKMGVAPLHSWLVTIASALPWFSIWLLLIPQKIAPLLIMNSLMKKETFTIMIMFIFLTAMVGAVGGLTTPSLKKMMTYSSISQMAWLLSSIFINLNVWFLYFFIYSLITSTILLSLHFMKIYKLNDLISMKQNLLKFIMMISMLAMAGLPPFSGFMMKLMLIMKILENNKTYLLFPLILASLTSLFFYTRFFYMSMMNTSFKNPNLTNTMIEKNLIFLNILTLPLGMMMFL